MNRLLLRGMGNLRVHALIALFIAMPISVAVAQGEPESTEEAVAKVEMTEPDKVHGQFLWGPRVGFDIFAMENTFGKMRRHDNGMGFGFSAGAIARYIYDNRWFVDAGISFAYDTTPLSIHSYNQNQNDNGLVKYDASRCALQLPISLGYKLKLVENFYFCPYTGVMLSYGLSGDVRAPKGMPDYDLYGSGGVWKRFSCSWSIGWNFNMGSSAEVGFAAYAGVTRMANQNIFESATMNEVTCRIYLTYLFTVKRNQAQAPKM